MTAKSSVPAVYTCEADLVAERISAAVGFDVTGSYPVADTLTVTVEDTGSTGYAWAHAYARMMNYTFDVMDAGGYIGSGEAALPIGVIFVILQSADIKEK